MARGVHQELLPPEIDPAIFDAALEEVRAHVPGLRLSRAVYAHLPASLEGAHAADVVLAALCAAGDTAAIRFLEETLRSDLAAAAARAKRAGIDEDDLRQMLHHVLFAPRDGRPRIAQYSGRSALRTWLRVVLARLVVDHVRKRSGREAVAREPLESALQDVVDDPEIQVLKRHYRRHVALAFEAAVSQLPAADRNVLRHRYVEGLSIDAIAASRGIHRATAARRVNAAEQALQRDVHRRLEETLDVSRLELASVMRFIRSQMHLSVARLLG
ncbi:MAG: sigma-70 family RNA polymerase sigma factor [Myxococcota bacterium]